MRIPDARDRTHSLSTYLFQADPPMLPIDTTSVAQTANTKHAISDWLGMAASIGCAIHCAAMPLVIGFLPMLGLSFLADESFHQVMVAVCTVLALAAFVPGWRKHRKWLPLGVAMVGLAFIGTAAFALEDTCACCTEQFVAGQSVTGEAHPLTSCSYDDCVFCQATAQTNRATAEAKSAEQPEPQFMAGITPWVTPFGGILLVAAHIMNRRFSCLCGCCPPKNS